MSRTSLIFGALGLGIACGLFLGEYASGLRIIGDIYVGLLQMTVLPYIIFALIANIGRMSLAEGRLLAGVGLVVFLGLWAIAALTVLLISLSFPELTSGAFFSTSLIEPPPELDLLNLFVPSNLFRALADNAVPAVVVFSLLFGVAIVGFEEKKGLLDHFSLVARALHRISSLVVKFTPLGIFGIAASAAGTLTIDELGRLQGYLLTFGACVLLLTFWVLPMLVASCTPFGYRQILRASDDALVTAFVTGSVFPVIPMLIDSVKTLFEERFREDPQHAGFPDFILPVAYPFPNSGNVIDLIFVPFAAWFVGNALGLAEQLYVLGAGFFLMFGKVFLTIPLLLQTLRIPQDMFQLFLAAGVVAARTGDLLSSMHYLVFTILTTAFMTGLLRVRWKRLVCTAGIGLMLGLLAIGGIRSLLQFTFGENFSKAAVLSRMEFIETSVPARVLDQAAPNPHPLRSGENRLDRIGRLGSIRVGYRPDHLPYSYSNSAGQLVGFDVELMHKLARDLGVVLEFVPYELATLRQQLKDDHFDIAISGLTATPKRAADTLNSESYLVVNMALVVPDYRRGAFETEDNVRRLGPITVGVEEGSYFAARIRRHFPEFQIVELRREREFFENPPTQLDALITNAEGGSAWTLLYPGYTTVNPLQRRESAPLVFLIAGHDLALNEYLETWIDLKRIDGGVARLFDHWMLGKVDRVKNPRWSVIRNVLHWVE